MVVITGVILLAILAGLFILFRGVGWLGQQPTARERMRHNAGEDHRPGPRADGLD